MKIAKLVFTHQFLEMVLKAGWKGRVKVVRDGIPDDAKLVRIIPHQIIEGYWAIFEYKCYVGIMRVSDIVIKVCMKPEDCPDAVVVDPTEQYVFSRHIYIFSFGGNNS